MGTGAVAGGSRHPGAPQGKGAAARRGAARSAPLRAETLPGKMRVGGDVGRGGRNSRPVPHRAISRVTIKAPVFLTQFLRQNSGREEEEGAARVTRARVCLHTPSHACSCTGMQVRVLGGTDLHTCASVHTRVRSPGRGPSREDEAPPGPACRRRAVLQGGGEGFAALAWFYFCFCLSSEAASARSL